MAHFKTVITSVCMGILATGMASAEELGKKEYMNNCASCHGETGMGAGPLSELMTVEVPSLTTLSADNDGKFPMLEVIHTIDGRQGTRGHGYPMPVWGDRFTASLENSTPFGAEAVVRGRVLSIAYYLESIQQ